MVIRISMPPHPGRDGVRVFPEITALQLCLFFSALPVSTDVFVTVAAIHPHQALLNKETVDRLAIHFDDSNQSAIAVIVNTQHGHMLPGNMTAHPSLAGNRPWLIKLRGINTIKANLLPATPPADNQRVTVNHLENGP